jgi:hypothetical protein
VSDVPQFGQKRNVALTGSPQFGHAPAASAPHAWQKRFPGISSVLQRAQRIARGYAARRCKSTRRKVVDSHR